jgi:type I restriction enzyme, S subunit
MTFEWRSLTLKDAGVSLIDCDHRTPKTTEQGYPYITIPQLKDGRILVAEARRISPADFKDWTKKLKPREHDVIVVRRCNSGESAVVPQGLDCAIGQNLVVLRANGISVAPQYLRWLVRGPEWWEEVRKFLNVGAVFDSLKCRDIPGFELSIPPIEEQCRISRLLDALDDRMEHNRTLAANLEAIARALFKSWFVDFDPVRARAAGEAPLGLAPDLAALFPDRFVESVLGEIPEGWTVKALDEAFQLNPKRNLPKGTLAQYLDMSNTPTRGHVPDQIAYRAFHSGSKFSNGDTLLARITPCLENGKAAFVDFLPEHEVGWGSTEFIVMRPKAPLPAYFGYLLARHAPFKAHAISSMSGTSGRQRVQPDSLATWELVVPSPPVGEAFGNIVEPLRASIACAHAEIRALTQLRDLLLPRLISGKLRVQDAEQALEVA